jgi:hypothetical protein
LRLEREHPECDLLHTGQALGSAGSFPRRLDSRQQQGDQNPDDGNDDKQLNERKSGRSAEPRPTISPNSAGRSARGPYIVTADATPTTPNTSALSHNSTSIGCWARDRADTAPLSAANAAEPILAAIFRRVDGGALTLPDAAASPAEFDRI